ncbi:MAG: hypothetical protein Q8R47_04935 [Nanoarchaeota archaeon]|nr:hypothetical protein [Nanoarchaeota archaeon]
MNAVRRFEEFIKEGVVKVQAPDKSRAKFLITESGNSYRLLSELMEKIKVENHSANMFVKSCYDILMELIRARMLLDGYNASGFGAHEAEVAYLRILGYSETEIQFVDRWRYFRNGMLYYGTILDQEYAQIVIKFTKKNYTKLKEMSI